MLEASVQLIDALPHPGGQCVELYGDKPIYDIPGIPACTGQALVDGLLQQLAPFAPPMHLGQLVDAVRPHPDGGFVVSTDKALQIHSKTVFIAGGVGAFVPRCPAIDGLQALRDTQLHFDAHYSPPPNTEHLLILGDGDTALEAALRLAQSPARPQRITLIHRRDVFTAEAPTQTAFHAALADGSLHFIAAQLTAITTQHGVLQSVSVADNQGDVRTLDVNQILVLQGLSPKLGPIADWGLAMERRLINIDPASFATSVPGIFALGDIVNYPGKKKLIASGFHEAIMAAFAAMPFIHPDRKPLLQYTSSSSHLQKLLGVEDARASQKHKKTTL